MTVPFMADLFKEKVLDTPVGQVKKPELDMVNRVFYEAMRLIRSHEVSEQEVSEYIARQTNGQYQNPTQLVERAREIESAPDILGGVALSALQGVSMEYLDEIVGAFGGDKAEVRRQVGSFRKEFPKTALASEVGGAMAVPGLAAVRGSGMAATLPGRIAFGAGIGAAEGAAAMAGARDPGTRIDAETGEFEKAPDDFLESVVARLPSAAGGLGVGAVLGGVVGSLQRPASRLLNKLTGKPATETPEMAARKFAQEAADATPRGREGILADLRAKQADVPEAVLADVSEMRPVAQAASSVSKEARDIAGEILPARERAALGRVRRQLESAASSENGTLTAHADNVAQRMADGRAAYQELEQAVPSITSDAIEDMFRDVPLLRESYEAVQKHATLMGQPLEPLFVEVIEEGGQSMMVRNPEAVMDFRTMQAMKNEMGSRGARLASTEKDAVKGRDILRQAQEFYDEARKVIDGYGDAQRVWADLMDEQDAAEMGMNFVNKKASVVASDIAQMSPNELTAYRESAAVSFLDMLDNRKRRGNIADIFNTNAMDERLRVMLPDEDSYQGFIRMLDVEADMQATSKALTGSTAGQDAEALRRKALEIDLPASGAEGVAELAAHPAPALAALRFGAAGRKARAATKAAARAQAMGGPLQRGLLDTRFSGAQNLLRGPTMPTLSGLNRMLNSPRELVTLFGGGGG